MKLPSLAAPFHFCVPELHARFLGDWSGVVLDLFLGVSANLDELSCNFGVRLLIYGRSSNYGVLIEVSCQVVI